MNVKSTTVAWIMAFCGCYPLIASNSPQFLWPSDLRGPCSIVDAKVYEDDSGSGGFILVDGNGKRLRFIYTYNHGQRVYFGQPDGSKVESEPGSPEEQCLLKISKTSFTERFGPIEQPVSEYYAQLEKKLPKSEFDALIAIQHFIIVLEHRCKFKKEIYTGW